MDPFTCGAESLTRSGEDRHAPRAGEQGFGESRRVVDEMLAIVEYDENATLAGSQGYFVDRILLETKIEPESGSGGCDICVPFSIGARSTKATAWKAARRRSATATATVVLPIPPGPTNDNRRCRVASAVRAAITSSRPTTRAI